MSFPLIAVYLLIGVGCTTDNNQTDTETTNEHMATMKDTVPYDSVPTNGHQSNQEIQSSLDDYIKDGNYCYEAPDDKPHQEYLQFTIENKKVKGNGYGEFEDINWHVEFEGVLNEADKLEVDMVYYNDGGTEYQREVWELKGEVLIVVEGDRGTEGVYKFKRAVCKEDE